MTRSQWILFLTISILAPKVFAQNASPCFPRGSFDSTPRWDGRQAKHTAQYLQLLGEPCLFPLHNDPRVEVYRFLWLRTFNPPVSARLEIQASGTGMVTVTTMQGEAGFGASLKGPTTVASRPVSADEVSSFRELLRRTRFMTIPTIVPGDQQGTDGSEWRIEAVVGGQYHTASRWSPTISQGPGKKAIAELGETLAFEIGKFQVDPDEID